MKYLDQPSETDLADLPLDEFLQPETLLPESFPPPKKADSLIGGRAAAFPDQGLPGAISHVLGKMASKGKQVAFRAESGSPGEAAGPSRCTFSYLDY